MSRIAILLAASALATWVPISVARASDGAGLGVVPETRAAATSRAPASGIGLFQRWLSRSDQEQLRAVEESGQRQVADLVARLRGLPPGPERIALERSVARVKLETRVRFLELLAQQARSRGQEQLADEAKRAAKRLAELLEAGPDAATTQGVKP